MTAPDPSLAVPSPQRRRWPPSAVLLLLVNAVPLAGVLLWHWSVFAVVLLYWCENVIVGAFNVLRMLCAQPGSIGGWVSKATTVPFFMVHYGMFTLVHGVFVFALFSGTGIGHGGTLNGFTAAAVLAAVRGAGLTWPAAGLLASHAFSFFHNYLGGGEYRRANVSLLLFQPYARVAVLHVVTLVGGFLTQSLGSPVVALVLLVLLKTALDAAAHLRERSKLAAAS
jgi:uncharacterized protein DUF6498